MSMFSSTRASTIPSTSALSSPSSVRRVLASAFVCVFVLAAAASGATVAAPAAATDDTSGTVDSGGIAADGPDASRSNAVEAAALRAAADDWPVINHTYVLDRTPATVNSIEVRSVVEVPENLANITLTLPPDASIRRVDGFRRLGPNRVGWDETAPTARPEVVYTVPANRTDSIGRVGVETGRYAFVDLAGTRAGAAWTYGGASPRYESSVVTAGEGIATDLFAYMGPYTTRSYDGSQEFLYVRTAAASPALPPGNLTRSLSAVGSAFDVGERDDRVVLFAPPEALSSGGRSGGASLWVNLEDGTDDSDWEAWQLWYHEYVHTRQNISADSGEDAYWLIEASAEYYGGYFAWQEGHMTDEEYRAFLAADEHADARLTEAVRGGDDREYTKGRRVVGALDVRIRRATGGERTFADVLRAVNRRDVTYGEFRGIVRRVANDTDGSLGAWLDRHVRTTATPPVPDDVAAAYDADGAGDAGADGTSDGGDTDDPAPGPPALAGRSSAPTDPDGDGRYEDVNGDGDVTPGDATVLFDAVFAGDPAVTEHAAAFDFSGDGSLAPGDATVLFDETFA